MCDELGLIDGTLADNVAAAYQTFRKLQHQIRLQGYDRARVDAYQVANDAPHVKQLWANVFG